MTSMGHAAQPHGATVTLPRDFGLPGWVAISWTAAGGFLLGGFLVAIMTLTGGLSGGGLLMTSSGLFLVGGVAGFIHGSVLGFFGRPAEMSARRALGAILLAGVYALPTLAIGVVLSGWVAMTVVSLYTGNVVALALSGAAWLLAGSTVVAGIAQGRKALVNAYARWPERKLGTVLVAASFAALMATFVADRPVLWGIQLRVTETGAILLAVFATIWIAGPLVTLALRAVQQVPRLREVLDMPGTRPVITSVGMGLLVGLILGLVALPFFTSPLRVAVPGAAAGLMGTAVISLSRALIDEVLLRLFLVSATAWLILRWRSVRPGEAAAAAILVGALVQFTLYLPWVFGIGFPTMVTAAAFVLLVVVLPALALGALYWMRGFGAALLAHATAIMLIGLIAG
jgi:hypothetical protein